MQEYHNLKQRNLSEREKEFQSEIFQTETKMAERKPELKDSVSGHHAEKSPQHDKETHGTSDDIDENTPIDVVKGPGLFERMKEEVEAVVEAVIHPHKDSGSHDSSSK